MTNSYAFWSLVFFETNFRLRFFRYPELDSGSPPNDEFHY